MFSGRLTLSEFLMQEKHRHEDPRGDLNGLIHAVALACKAIANRVACGELAGVLGTAESSNVQGEVQKKMDIIANEIFARTTAMSGVAGMISEENEDPLPLAPETRRGRYLLLFDPLDGSSNIDVNVSVGSIFSILRAKTPGQDAATEDFLQPGTEQVCAGFSVYGPATMLVITVGTGAHAFTLDQTLGEFLLTHADLRIPEETGEFAINASNARHWETAVKRYVDECLAGASGPRGRDFNMRWVASLVAEAYRILMRGGVFLYPRDTRDPDKPGKLRLLYEVNPVSFIVEQAGGAATTGRFRTMEHAPISLHERIGFVFGSKQEVERIAGYHADETPVEFDAPLFGSRGLFRGLG